MDESKLIKWFQEVFRSRTPPERAEEVDPGFRVIWPEIWLKMQDMGYEGGSVAGRTLWRRLIKKHGLKLWALKLAGQFDGGYGDG